MDLKRYSEINGREALERLSNGFEIYSKAGGKYQVDFSILDYTLSRQDGILVKGEDIAIPFTLTEILKETWYVKKPFDVRAEMLARPSEWVGAYKWKDRWFKVRFNAEQMRAEESNLSKETVIAWVWSGGLDICIPIEDVPKEELT